MVTIPGWDRRSVRYYALFLAGLSLFAFLSIRRISQTVSTEELSVLAGINKVFSVGLAQRLLDPNMLSGDFILLHPHLYLFAILQAYAIFGWNDVSARLVGVLMEVITILLIFIITKRFVFGEYIRRVKIAVLTSLCYAFVPTTTTGAMLIQIDTTILVPLILCFVGSAAYYAAERKRIWLLWLGLSVVLSFWARVSTPSVIIVLVTLYFLASSAEASTKRMIIVTLACGMAAFFTSWFFYCKTLGFFWLTPFFYTAKVAVLFGTIITIKSCAEYFLYLALWLGPFTLLTVIVLSLCAVRSFMKDPKVMGNHGIFLFCGVATLLGFTLIFGAHHGYPRYQSPAVPLIYLGAVLMLSRMSGLFLTARKTILIFLLMFLAQIIVLGDPLYSIRYLAREAAVYAPAQTPIIIKALVYKFMLFLLVCALLWFCFIRTVRRNIFIGFLILCSIASNVGLSVLQSLAHYHVGLSYGEEGMPELVRYLRRNVEEGSIVVATTDVTHRLGSPPFPDNFLWDTKGAMAKYLEDARVSALVVSIIDNTIAQLKAMREDHPLAEILQRQFEYKHIGTFRVWTRKKTAAGVG